MSIIEKYDHVFDTQIPVKEVDFNDFKSEISRDLLNIALGTNIKQFQYNYKLKKGEIKESDIPVHYSVLNNLELNIGNQCSLACKYCYLERFYDKLYPMEKLRFKDAVENTKILLKWLYSIKQVPRTIEIFGGDPFMNELGFATIEVIYDFYKDKEVKPDLILIPSNFTWVYDDKRTERVYRLEEKFKSIGISFSLSISMDGILEEENRPLKKGYTHIKRDDEYVNKIFKLQKEHHYGFHPMVYSNKIEYWMDNFIWFQKKFYEYGINPFGLYLLEVRNYEWTQKQIAEYQIFMRFLVKFLFKVFQKNDLKIMNELLNKHYNFNTLSSIFTKTQRGIGCSLQTSFMVNTQDLSIQACHRNNYVHTRQGRFIVEEVNGEKTIVGMEQNNPEFFITLKTYSVTNQPYCVQCPVKNLCGGLCPASQYENFKDPFIPIPTQCLMEWFKIFQFVYTYSEIGLFNVRGNYMPEKEVGIYNQLKLMNENPKIVELLTSKDDVIDEKINEFIEYIKKSERE